MQSDLNNPFSDPSVTEVENPVSGTALMQSSEGAPPPAWLADSAVAQAHQSDGGAAFASAPYIPPQHDGGSGVQPAYASPAEQQPPPAKKALSLPQLITYMRVANVLVAILMVLSSATSFLTAADVSSLVLGAYISCFGCLMCCFEAHLKQVSILLADNFGFLYNAKGRCLFLLLVGTLCFSLNIIGKITGALTCCVAAFNLYVLIKHPNWEKETQQADLKGEGPESLTALATGYAADYARNNPDQVQQMATAGVNWAKENPELAMQGAQAVANAHAQRETPPGQGQPAFDL